VYSRYYWTSGFIRIGPLIAGLIQEANRVTNLLSGLGADKPLQAPMIEPSSLQRDAPVLTTESVSVAEPIAETVEPLAPIASITPIEPTPTVDVTAPVVDAVVAEPVVDAVATFDDSTGVGITADIPQANEDVAQIFVPEPIIVPEPAIVTNIIADTELEPVAESIPAPEPEPAANAVATANSNAEPVAQVESESELTLASLARSVLTEMTARSEDVAFSVGTASLTDKSESLLQLIFEDLFLYSESDITIEVASRDAAAESENLALSNERGALIKTFLIDRGLDPERLIVSVLSGAAAPDKPQHLRIQADQNE